MPRMTRREPKSLTDRPGRWKLLLRRQRRYLRPAGWSLCGLAALAAFGMLLHAARPGTGESLAPTRERLGRLSAALGLRVTDVVFEGRSNTPEPLLRAALGVTRGDPLLGFSVAAARTRIETLAWVRNATVERRLPGTVVVQLSERRPYAIWQHQGRFALIDRRGQVVAGQTVTGPDGAAFKNLPLLVGAGAPEGAGALLDALDRFPGLQARMTAAVRVGGRRWNLQMANGTAVMLPEGHEAEALKRLSELQDAHDLLDRPLQVVDMRLPDRLVLRPRPAPAPDSANGASKGAPKGAPGAAASTQATPRPAPAPARRPT